MATSGLSAKETTQLNEIKRKLAAVEPRIFLAGGSEQRELYLLIEEIERRLNPKTPDQLATEAEAFFNIGNEVDWFRLALASA